MSPPIRPFGTWPSPISAELVSRAGVRLGELWGDGERLYWLEGRPAEAGRQALVHCGPDGRPSDLGVGANVRTRVHEYGGGSYAVADGRVWFVDFDDQRVWQRDPDGSVRPLTAADGRRHADFDVDRRRRRLICVEEDHRSAPPSNRLVALSWAGGEPLRLRQGADFCAAPRLSPDGSRLAWIEWDHPDMPWDRTSLWLADVDGEGRLQHARRLAGGEESILQPQWSPDGDLMCVSDRSGFWNLYRADGDGLHPVWPVDAECAEPPWLLAQRTYVFLNDGRLACVAKHRGRSRLHLLDPRGGDVVELDVGVTDVAPCIAAWDRGVAIVAGSPTQGTALLTVDVDGRAAQTLRRSLDVDVDRRYLSIPRDLAVPTTDGAVTYAHVYAPHNQDVRPPEEERPPLLVLCHGGPTAASSTCLDLRIQFWTSRGFAVAAVDYRGSSGYGRDYRRALEGRWGVADVADCGAVARWLAAHGQADDRRLLIAGGSAGGYTTLCALTFDDVFAAGASYYGVADLERLVRETHKFESHYLDRLVGPYPARRDLYVARSPVHHVDRLRRPVILFQGLEDPIVPPNQAEVMVAALRDQGIPVAYVAFAGEQHGFRRAETIRRALEAELFFYSRVLGFELGEAVEPVPVENL